MTPIFIRIPKTASRSIKSMGLFELLENDRGKQTHVPAVDYNGADWDERISFCVVRNPFDRIASSYFNLKLFSSGKGKGVIYHRANYKDILNFVQRKSFKEFVLDSLSPLYNVDHPHFKPQAYWVCDSDLNILVSHVLKYENLDIEWSNFLEEVGIDFVPLPVINKTNHKNFNRYYDKRMKGKIYEKYEVDFNLFGYGLTDVI